MSVPTTVVFDVLSLQDGSQVFTTDTPDYFNAPPINIQAETLAESDGASIVKRKLDPKTFKMNGYMQTADTPSLDLLIDSFKRALNKQNQNFDLAYGGSIRRHTATPQNIIISRDKGLNTAGWSVEFYCANPVGADTTTSSLLNATTITSSTSTSPITVDGSYKAEPFITVTVNSLTIGSGGTITISNDSTLRGLSVQRTWQPGDVLTIDVLNKNVYVNNGVVEFTGQFPVFDPGSGGIDYLDDFSARNVTISATYTRRFL